MAFQFKMPDIGEGIAEGEIVKIDIKVGDTIKEDDILFEVQNDKSVEEIPSTVSGKVLEVKVEEGTVARVGDVIVVVDDGSGDAAPAAAPAQAAAPAATNTFQFKHLILVKVLQKVKLLKLMSKLAIQSLKMMFYLKYKMTNL